MTPATLTTHTTSKLKVTLVKSAAKRLPKHKLCLQGLGLSRLNQSVELVNTPANRGMIDKVRYLVTVENLA